MSTTIKALIPAKQLEDVQTIQYISANVKALIDKCTVNNTSSGNVVLAVNLLNVSSDPASNSNLFVKNRTLAPNEAYLCPEIIGHVLEPGGAISTLAGASSSLSIRVSGREIS